MKVQFFYVAGSLIFWINKRMCQVEFQIEGFGRNEEQAFQCLVEGITAVEPEHLWGSISFAGEGAATAVIKDDLTLLAMALFIEVPEQLIADGQAILKTVSWPGEFFFRLDSTGLNIRLTGPVKGSTKISGIFPKDELIARLIDCGKRLAHFMSELSLVQPEIRQTAQNLQSALQQKISRLEGVSITRPKFESSL